MNLYVALHTVNQNNEWRAEQDKCSSGLDCRTQISV